MKMIIPKNDLMMDGPDHPTFHVRSDQMPEIKNWEVGKKYKMTIEVEQMSFMKLGGGFESGLAIMSYEVHEGKTYEDMDDHEFGKEQGKQMSKH